MRKKAADTVSALLCMKEDETRVTVTRFRCSLILAHTDAQDGWRTIEYQRKFHEPRWFVTTAFIAVIAGALAGCGASDQSEAKHRDANGARERSDERTSGSGPRERIPEYGSAVAP